MREGIQQHPPPEHGQAIRLLTTEEVSEITGIPFQTLCNWRVRGNGLPYVKMGCGRSARVRYDIRDLEKYVADHKHYPISSPARHSNLK